MDTSKKEADKALDKDLEKYPVEPISETEPASEKNVKAALKELNPDPESMDDERG